MKRSLLLFLFLSTTSLSAWSPTGHMVIGEIAKERLSNNTLARCTELIPVKVPPQKVKLGTKMVDVSMRTGSFVTACCWADDVRSDADREVHYIDIAFSADGTTPQVGPASKNIVKMLEDCVTVLKNPRASKTDRAVKLRYLLHLVGDIHQPLHAASRCTNEQPGGDRGGNDFPVVGAANLHSYWDGGVGLLKTTISRPLKADGIAKIAALKAQCMAAYVGPVPDRANPANNAGAASGTRPTTADFAAWTQESHELAKSTAYGELEPHDTPSAAYVANAQRVVRERVALAGYRLADLLNEIFK
jgi:hypothetical protein